MQFSNSWLTSFVQNRERKKVEKRLRQDLDFLDQKYQVMFDKVSDLKKTIIQVQQRQYMRGEGSEEDPIELLEEEADALEEEAERRFSDLVEVKQVPVEARQVPAPTPKGQGPTGLKRGPRTSMMRTSPYPDSYLDAPIADLAPEDSMSNIGQARIRERVRVALAGPGPSNWRDNVVGGHSIASWDRRLAEEWAEEQERLVSGLVDEATTPEIPLGLVGDVAQSFGPGSRSP